MVLSPPSGDPAARIGRVERGKEGEPMRIASRKVVLPLAVLVLMASGAHAAPTAEQSCQKSLSFAAGTYLQCMEKATGAFYGGGDYAGKVAPAFGKCVDKYSANWPKLVKKYDGKGTSCTGDRYADNGDGTFADRLTSLVWEKKTDDGGIHDKDNLYTWTTGSPGKEDGTVVATFLITLNSSPALWCVGNLHVQPRCNGDMDNDI